MVEPAPPAGFELVAPLGATGSAWSAHGPAGPVVLKWTDASGREATALAAVAHPGVVRLLDVVPDPDGRDVLVLEHVPGGSLADRLVGGAALDPGRVAALGAGLAEALAAVHEAGFVHRDVTPANVLLATDGSPRLADLGLAATRAGRRSERRVLGTPGFVDPRVAAGADPDAAADLYALGATLHAASAGRPPPEVGAPAPLPVDGPPPGPELAGIVDRCLAADAGDRPRSARSVAAELRALAASVPPAAAGAASGSRAATPDRSTDGRPAASPPRASDASPADVPAGAPAGAPAGSRGGSSPDVPAVASAFHRPTRDFGPRPPRPAPVLATVRRAAVVVPFVALVATAGVLASPLSPLRADEPEAPTPTAVPTPPCPPADGRPGVVVADLDLDGCAVELAWDGTVLVVPPGEGVAAARYAIGRPGDELLFGDWDCDGIATPALHRAEAGEAVVFDDWPAAGDPLEGRTQEIVPGGTARVERSDGCDELLVER